MIVMKNRMFKLAGVVITCAVMTACGSSNNSPNSPNKGKASSGDADFTKFVSIGDSLTAGFADGALYLLGQQNSFPNILAQQFADADGVAVAFEQPLVSDNLGGLLFGGTPNPAFDNRLVLNTNPDPSVEGEAPSPERLVGTPTTEVIGSGLNGMTFNNVGVPGAKSFHLVAPNFGDSAGLFAVPPTANPYFVRFATATDELVINDAVDQAPSFFTLWIGNNDVLGFATSGGDDSDPITPEATFKTVYEDLIFGTINAVIPNAQGVLINIPDVSTIPFFTTVPFNPVPLDQASADGLNGAFVAYNAGVQSLVGIAPNLTQEEADARTIVFVEGQQNALLILDEDLEDLTGFNAALINMRQATATDLILLTTSAKIGELVDENDDPLDPASPRWGVSSPLVDADLLIPSEIAAIDTARQAYNTIIKDMADSSANYVFFDAAALMKQLSESSIDFGNGSINADFATGGAFGLDGVHPTGRGYAVIANAIIDEINTGFNANVFKVDPALFPSIFLK